ncbi:MAG: hypothetical protein ABSC51_01195 [Gaiellaceae bacterium]|jgi:hypothetical protein
MPLRALVVYDLRIVFAVDLDSETIENAEICSLNHAATSLEFRGAAPFDFEKLQKRAREIVESNFVIVRGDGVG